MRDRETEGEAYKRKQRAMYVEKESERHHENPQVRPRSTCKQKQ